MWALSPAASKLGSLITSRDLNILVTKSHQARSLKWAGALLVERVSTDSSNNLNIKAYAHSVRGRARYASQMCIRDRIMTTKVPETVLSEREASQGVKLGHMRYVLMLSLVLCAAAGIIFYLFH
jgi:hypothetical protein